MARLVRPVFVRVAASICAAAIAMMLPIAGRSADPYEIDTILSETGNLAFVGKTERDALEALEDTVNHSGGIDGRPIKFVFTDDQSNPQIAVQLLNNFLAKKPPVVLGPTTSAGCNALFAMVATGPVLYCTSSAVAPSPGGWGFAINPSNLDQVSAGIRYARLRGWTRLATISSTDATGQIYDANLDATLALPENKAMTLVTREHLNPADISAAAQLSRVKNASPQALLVGATGAAAGTVFHAAADAGLDLPVMTGAGNATYPAMKQFASFLPKQLYFMAFTSMVPDELGRNAKKATTEFLNALKVKGILNDGIAGGPWDAGLVIVGALRKLGTGATATQVRDYIANLTDFYGSNGQYDFKRYSQRGLGANGIVIVLWDPVKSVWTGVSKPGGVPAGRT
jgi:branched-chain amino acid transport system substrate-binding protein